MTKEQAIQQFYDDYDLIGVEIVKQLALELEQQGHKVTGNLARSIIAATQKIMDGAELSVSHLSYGVELNTGIPASKVPRSGAAYGNLLFDLVKWIRLRKLAFGAAQAYRFANNIIRKAQKTGFPTPGAYRFTRNTRRTGWIDYVVKTYQVDWEDKIAEAGEGLVDNYLDALFESIERQFAGTITVN